MQSTALVLIGAFACVSSAPLTCSQAMDYFSAVIDTTLLWQSPSVAPGRCYTAGEHAYTVTDHCLSLAQMVSAAFLQPAVRRQPSLH